MSIDEIRQAAIATPANLTNITESLSLISVIGSIRPSPRCRRSSFPLVTASVLPFDQAHVQESEDHASDRERDLDACSSSVSRTFGRREQVSGADAEWWLVDVDDWKAGMRTKTYATACARATARGTATARRDSLPALLADQVTIKGVQTVTQKLGRQSTSEESVRMWLTTAYHSAQSPQGSELQSEPACCLSGHRGRWRNPRSRASSRIGSASRGCRICLRLLLRRSCTGIFVSWDQV